MTTNSAKFKRIITIDDAPEIMGKYLSLLHDEVERIEAIPINKRSKEEINIAIKCITALNTIIKVDVAQEKVIRSEVAGNYRMMAPSQIQQLIGKKTSDDLPTAVLQLIDKKTSDDQ